MGYGPGIAVATPSGSGRTVGRTPGGSGVGRGVARPGGGKTSMGDDTSGRYAGRSPGGGGGRRGVDGPGGPRSSTGAEAGGAEAGRAEEPVLGGQAVISAAAIMRAVKPMRGLPRTRAGAAPVTRDRQTTADEMHGECRP